jgi:uncharacterized protein (TIGR03435 family)
MIGSPKMWEKRHKKSVAKWRVNVCLIVSFTMAAASLLVSGALAQTPASSQRTFDVVSIRTNKSPSDPISMGNQPGGRFVATNATIKMLFSLAFSPMQDFQIVGGPDWLTSERFDIEARADNPFAPGEAAEALRAMLEDRLVMKTHRELREVSSYILTVAKSGLKMEAVEPDVTTRPTASTVPSGARLTRATLPKGIFLGPGNVQAPSIQMSQLVNFLSTMTCRPVIDHTELEGYYSVSLVFVPEVCPGEMRIFGVIPVRPVIPENSDGTPAGDGYNGRPSISAALQEQLGLRIEPSKSQVEIVVIDSIQKPTEN